MRPQPQKFVSVGAGLPRPHRDQVKGIRLVLVGFSIAKPLTLSALGREEIAIASHTVGVVSNRTEPRPYYDEMSTEPRDGGEVENSWRADS